MVDSSPPIVSLDVTSEDNTEIEVSNLETPIDVFIDCDMKSTGVFVKEREVTGTQFASVDVNTGGDTVALRVQLFFNDVSEGSVCTCACSNYDSTFGACSEFYYLCSIENKNKSVAPEVRLLVYNKQRRDGRSYSDVLEAWGGSIADVQL